MFKYISLLRDTKSLQELKRFHSILAHRGHDQLKIYANLLIELYGRFGCITEAEAAFYKTATPDETTNTNMIMSYAQNGHLQKAEKLFLSVREKGPRSYVEMLKGYLLHGCVVSAWDLFSLASTRDLNLWNVMVEGNARNGYMDLALQLLQRTPYSTLEMYTAMMVACAKYGAFVSARRFFDQVKYKELSTWNEMIRVYAQGGHVGKAIEIFRLMDLDGFLPDETSFTLVFDGCADAWALQDGKLIIDESLAGSTVELFQRNNGALRSAMNMFARCECFEGALELLSRVPERDVELWNILLSAYGNKGGNSGALALFRTMNQDGAARPDKCTFLAILTATGELHTAMDVLRGLNFDFLCPPVADHFLCLVNQFSRSGDLENAEDLLSNMPFEPEPVGWLNLCKTRLDWELWIS